MYEFGAISQFLLNAGFKMHVGKKCGLLGYSRFAKRTDPRNIFVQVTGKYQRPEILIFDDESEPLAEIKGASVDSLKLVL